MDVSPTTIKLAATQIAPLVLPSIEFRGPYSPSSLEDRISHFNISLASQYRAQPTTDNPLDVGRDRSESVGRKRDHSGSFKDKSMSPRTVQPSTSPHSHNSINGPHGHALPPIVSPPESTGKMSEPKSAGSEGMPPFSRPNSTSGEAPSRMQHILNPAISADEGSRTTPELGIRQGPLPPISLSRSGTNERTTPAQTPYGGPSGPNHRLSAPNLASPTGTIDAKKSPFLPSAASGPPVSAYPTPTSQPYGMKSAYPFPPQGLPLPGPPHRRGSDGMSAVGSRTGSPTPSYSSYGQPSTAQGSPRSQFSAVTHRGSQALYHAQMQQHSGHVSQPPPNAQQMHHPHGQFPPPHHHAMVQPTGPYRMMTLDTEHGQIQVPVDVQAASKMADEKRRRNAGASARFRQRRKEKEREASTTISRLEDKVRDLADEKDYYRMERDYFRDLVYKHEGARANLVPRMPSPVSERTRQGSLASSREAGTEGGLSPGSGGTAEYRESGDRGSDDGRIVRRRVSGYEPEQRGPATHQQHQQQARQHQQLSHHSSGTPSPQHGGNGSYAYPSEHSDHAVHAQAMTSVPQAMRTGPFTHNGSPTHVQYEMRRAAPS